MVMNERIRELAIQSGLPTALDYHQKRYEKFAELIVAECITNIVHDTANWPGDEGRMAYYQGVQDAVKSIRKHFGVEE
jgi:hypothetical protein